MEIDMINLSFLSKYTRRLIRGDRGNIAMMFGLMLVPLTIAAGLGIDYEQGQNFKNALQGAADSAALAGASVYTSQTSYSTATTVAQNYMNNAEKTLPPHTSVSYTVTPATLTANGSTSGYTVAVTATATVQTSFMAIMGINTTTISVSATAEDPVVNGNFNLGGFVSYACDLNQLYYYIVPSGGGVPAKSAMNLLWSNNNASPPASVSFSVTAGQQIGFALENTTGARSTSLGGCNYGDNMYGSHPGDTQYFYSSLQPPSLDYNKAPGGGSTGTHGVYETTQDCSLVTEQGVTVAGKTTYPAAPQNSCYTTSGSGENTDSYNGSGSLTGICSGCGSSGTTTMKTVMNNAAPSCGQLNGNSVQYNWNDMGAPIDSYNYGNDMQYNFSCTGSGGAGVGGATGVILIK
jgi:Flp pilus assembly protein TadG